MTDLAPRTYGFYSTAPRRPSSEPDATASAGHMFPMSPEPPAPADFPAAGSGSKLPVVDATCKHADCLRGNDKGTYRLVGGCYNCSSDAVGIFTVGHETSSQVECPVCGCRRMHWRGVEGGGS